MHKFIAHKHSFLSWQKDPILRETLERLSEIFLNITELEPWNALGDSEVIGVVDPLSGETFYNIFMGSMGTLFGIASYRGVLGYYCYKKAKSTSVLREQDEWHLQQNSILSTLEYPHEMYDDVRNTYQGYRIRLEDKKRHPSFIMYEPEFFPVIVSETKARSLLVVFEQILQVCNRLIRGDLTGIIKAKKIFCRVSSNEADGLVWRDSWQDVPDYVPEQLRFSEAAFTHFVKTQDRVTRNGLTWEIDYFIQELPVVNDTGRSFFLASYSSWTLNQVLFLKPS